MPFNSQYMNIGLKNVHILLHLWYSFPNNQLSDAGVGELEGLKMFNCSLFIYISPATAFYCSHSNVGVFKGGSRTP